MGHSKTLTLTLYPNQFGIGYVIADSPKGIVNYGIARIKKHTNDVYIRRLKNFLEYYRPCVVVLKGYDKRTSQMSKRIQSVVKSLKQVAEKNDVEVFTYSRSTIKETFTKFGITPTKFAINSTIAGWYPELKSKLPDLRKNTQTEAYHTGIFDAFSLMLTHYYMQ